jgi:hypothetical protein
MLSRPGRTRTGPATKGPALVSEQNSTVGPSLWRWVVLLACAAAVAVVGWVLLTAPDAVVHAHPVYPALLAATVVGALAVGWRTARRTPARRSALRWAVGVLLLGFAVIWVGAMAWLRPFAAVEPALTAMRSDAAVAVSESATTIVLRPTGDPDGTGVLFQPGARVDARAYAAVLRPLAEAGHPVVIAKQPLGIAFLALGDAHPEVTRWVVGGHSLGGTVAAIEADDTDDAPTAPAAGLLLFASYPASDISSSLTAAVESVSGSRDGLATPANIEASRANLPADAGFTVIEGAAHAQFGDYGPQPGDGTPTISDDEARTEISQAAVGFVDGLPTG